MMNTGPETLTIDGVTYQLDDLSAHAKSLIANIQFVDSQIQQLNNEWAIADTARIGYANALKAEVATSLDN